MQGATGEFCNGSSTVVSTFGHANKQGIFSDTRTMRKLLISLRTAYAKEYSLDKEQTSYSDSIDALPLACKMYKMN